MELCLHIGTEKTGSTALQGFLRDNRERLKQQSVAVSASLGDPNHIAVPLLMLERGGQRAHIAKWLTFPNSDTSDLAGYCLDQLTQEGALRSNKLIISSEHIFSFSTDLEAVHRLQSFCESVSNDIKIIVYLRPQDKLVPSLISSRVRSGESPSMEHIISNTPWLYYDRVLENLSKTFGKERIMVRAYSGARLISDFLNAISVSEKGLKTDIERTNQSLDRVQIEILKGLNDRIPAFIDGIRNPIRTGLVGFVAANKLGPPLGLSEEQKELVRLLYEDSNNRLKEEFPLADGFQFFTDKTSSLPSNPSDDNLWKDGALDLLAELWLDAKITQATLNDQWTVKRVARGVLRRVRNGLKRTPTK